MTRKQALNVGRQLSDIAVLLTDEVDNSGQITQLIGEAMEAAQAARSAGIPAREQRVASLTNISEGFLSGVNTRVPELTLPSGD